MEVTLNTKRTSFYFLAGLLHLDHNNPGPIKVDLKIASENQAKALLIAYRLDQIGINDIDELTKHLGEASPPASIVKENLQRKLESQKTSVSEKLLSLLTKPVASIKKEIPALQFNELKVLMKFEIDGKARKGLVKIIDERLKKLTKAKMAEIKREEELAVGKPGGNALITGGLAMRHWDNISEVVESEEEEITLNPPEKE